MTNQRGASRVWVAALAALAAVSFQSAASARALFVYKGNGSDGRAAVPQFTTYVGTGVAGVTDFIAFDSWTSFDNDAGWGIGGWKGSGYLLAESVPLTVTGTSLASVASGVQDAHYTKLAQTLVANGFSTAYIRLGWEFNGNWYPWAFKGHEVDFIAAYRHVVAVMRAASGASFKFVWNPALYVQQEAPDAGYPGDDVVDVVATDPYNVSFDANYTVASARWSSILNDNWGIQTIVAFAGHHGKPYAFPEWGTGKRPDGHGGGDDPLYIKNIMPYVNAAAFAGYWDFNASDFSGLISSGAYPNAGAELKADLAPAAAATSGLVVTSAQAGPTVSLSNSANGSATITVNFPTTSAPVNWQINLSQARKLGFSNGSGGLWGSEWAGGALYKNFVWRASSGTARVYVAPN